MLANGFMSSGLKIIFLLHPTHTEEVCLGTGLLKVIASLLLNLWRFIELVKKKKVNLV